MQEKLTIARPYAAAAFAYSEENGCCEAWSGLLKVLAQAVEDSSVSAFINHPKVSGEQILEFMIEVLGDACSKPAEHFLRTLIDAERLEIAPEISELFERFRADSEGVVEVVVHSAYLLSDTEAQKISEAVRKRTGRSCTIVANTDSSLIGGAVVKIGDSVIDLSLRGRLTSLEQLLA